MLGLCVDFGGSRVKSALVRDGETVASWTDPTPTTRLALNLTGALFAARLRKTGASADVISIAVPGTVEPATLALREIHGKYEFALGTTIADWANELAPHVCIENDARAALLGELRFGQLRGIRNGAIVTLGTGIGSAAAVDGVVLRGRRGRAGLLAGHSPIDYRGQRCLCGSRGCAEAIASTWAIDVRGGSSLRDYRAVFGRAHIDPAAAQLMSNALDAWGAAIAGLVNAFDPERVVIGGGVAEAGTSLLDGLRDRVGEHVWARRDPVSLVLADQPREIVLRGLHSIILDRQEVAA